MRGTLAQDLSSVTKEPPKKSLLHVSVCLILGRQSPAFRPPRSEREKQEAASGKRVDGFRAYRFPLTADPEHFFHLSPFTFHGFMKEDL
jgi:hypothetical protein